MASQNTATGIAYQQLKTLEGGNIGAIVEENIRFWKKYKDDKEADALAREAQQQEYQRKVAESQGKTFDELAKGIKLEDSDGYKRAQIVDYYEANVNNWTDLAKKASEGDNFSRTKLNMELQKLHELTTLDKNIALAAKNLEGGRNNPDFNPALDEATIQVPENFAKSLYNVNSNGNITIPDPKNPKQTIDISPSEANNMVLGLKFSGKFDPIDFGSKIADTLKLDANDGNKKSNRAFEVEAINKTREAFKLNPNALSSWAFANGISRERFDDLSEFELLDLSRQFAKSQVLPKIEEVSNYRANRNSDLAAKTAKQNLEDKQTTINLLTDEEGNRIQKAKWRGQDINLSPNDRILSLSGRVEKFTDPEGNVVTPTNILYSSDGKVSVIGKATEEKLVDATDASGNVIYEVDKDGLIKEDERGIKIPSKTLVVKELGDVRVDDNVTVGNVITNISNPNTNEKFRNLNQAKQVFEEIAPTITETKNENKYGL